MGWGSGWDVAPPAVQTMAGSGSGQTGTVSKQWADTQTTVGGVATFTPVDGGGAALFASIYSVLVTAEANTGVMTNVPAASLKLVSADRKTITVNVVIGAVLGVLGATVLAAPDGTKVHAVVLGA